MTMAVTALERLTHPGAGGNRRAPEDAPGPLGPQRLARPSLVSADFGEDQSTGPPHLTNKGTAVLDN